MAGAGGSGNGARGNAAPIGGIGGSGRAPNDGIGGSGRAPNDGNFVSFFPSSC